MIKFLIRTAVSLAFLAFFWYIMRDDLPQIAHVLRNADKTLMFWAVAIYFTTIFIIAKRLQLIFEAEEVAIGFLASLNITFIGFFFNNFLPTSVGGDIVKAMCASRITEHPVKSVTCVLIDRIFGLFTFVLIPSVSVIFFLNTVEHQTPIVPVIVYSLLALSIVFFFLLFNKSAAKRLSFIEKILTRLKFADKLRKIYHGLHNFKKHKLVMAKAMLLSLISQLIGIYILYLMAVALGSHADLIYFFLLIPVIHLISMLPSLNGLGIREGAYVYFLTPYIGKEYAAAISLLWLGLLLLSSAFGGVIYLLRHDYHVHLGKKKVHKLA